MCAEQPMELKDAGQHFQLVLPFAAFLFDRDCETLCNRVIRICDQYFLTPSERSATKRPSKS
jgi:hypothetical protein